MGMPYDEVELKVREYDERAKQIRRIANSVKTERVRLELFRIADCYDRMGLYLTLSLFS